MNKTILASSIALAITTPLLFAADQSANNQSSNNKSTNDDQTLVVTFEFASEANQTTWYNSMAADSVAWCSPASGVTAEYVRADWLNQDGSLSAKKMMEKKD